MVAMCNDVVAKRGDGDDGMAQIDGDLVSVGGGDERCGHLKA